MAVRVRLAGDAGGGAVDERLFSQFNCYYLLVYSFRYWSIRFVPIPAARP